MQQFQKISILLVALILITTHFSFKKLSPVDDLVFLSQHLTEHHNNDRLL